jgi:hypothetical protein
MPTSKPRHSNAEFARRGDAIYDREIAPSSISREKTGASGIQFL